jgi:hypothetical protein
MPKSELYPQAPRPPKQEAKLRAQLLQSPLFSDAISYVRQFLLSKPQSKIITLNKFDRIGVDIKGDVKAIDFFYVESGKVEVCLEVFPASSALHYDGKSDARQPVIRSGQEKYNRLIQIQRKIMTQESNSSKMSKLKARPACELHYSDKEISFVLEEGEFLDPNNFILTEPTLTLVQMQQLPFLHRFATKEAYEQRKAVAGRGLFWDEVTDETLDDDPIVNPLYGYKLKQI